MADVISAVAALGFIATLAFPRAASKIFSILGLPILLLLVILRVTVLKWLPKLPKFLLGVLITVALGSFFVATYIIQLTARWSNPQIFEEKKDRVLGTDDLQEVRNDLLSVLPIEVDEPNASEVDIRGIKESAKSRMQTAELIITFLFSLAIIYSPIPFEILSLPPITVNLLTIYLIFLPAAVFFRIVLLDVLAFSSVEEVETTDRFDMETAVAWQRAVTQTGIVPFACLTVAFSKRLSGYIYEKTLKVVELVFHEERGVFESLKKAVYS